LGEVWFRRWSEMSDQEDQGQEHAPAASDSEPVSDEKPFIAKPIESAPIMKQLDPSEAEFRIVKPDEKVEKTADAPPDSDQAGTSDE
jgi:hypothetical protein